MYAKLTAKLRYTSPRGNKTTLIESKLFHGNKSQYKEIEENQPDIKWTGEQGFVKAKFDLLMTTNQKASYRSY